VKLYKCGEKYYDPPFFTLNPYPRPSTASVFVKIILSSSKWTGVSLKTYRQNWQETVPGEEKVTAISDTVIDC
jgi:hypothetical protein